MAVGLCSHLGQVETVKQPKVRECLECQQRGDPWTHLRTCQTCGVTLCCDDSPNHHAREHARAVKHPVIASAEPGEHWMYCYVDDEFAEF